MNAPQLPFAELREQAIALRRAGKSRREIKEILGITNNEALTRMLTGEPPPAWTRRPNAKDDLRARARELRRQGFNYNEIVAELGVSKSSVSLWVRDLMVAERHRETSREARQEVSIAAPTRPAARSDPPKPPFAELREQAIALRRAGKSRRQIKETLGITSDGTITKLVAGELPPAWAARPNAKDDLRVQARELRAQGHTYNEIAGKLGVSKSSVSLWVRDLPRTGRLSYEEWRQRAIEGHRAYWEVQRPINEARRKATSETAAAEIGLLTGRELIIAGAIAYWCEGVKNKPYRRTDRVVFMNSDPDLIRFFLRFVEAAGISREQVIYQISIHESADLDGALQFWLAVTGASTEQFRRTNLKRHNPKTLRKNSGADYHGCLRVEVRRSSTLYRRIEGWAHAAMGTRTTGPGV